MKRGFYIKIAWEGIRKNRQLYFPYILTGIIMTMMSYIVFFLSSTEGLVHMKGGGTLRIFLPIVSLVVALFSLGFMFYSNSFLIRQRYREFGLYNVLGMDKGNLGRIMFWENFFSGGISVLSGTVLGIVLSKLAELIMCSLLREKVNYDLRIDLNSALKTVIVFSGIYFLLFLNSAVKVRRATPLELMKSSNVGEKPPKANHVIAIMGIVILAIAYYIALSIEQPLSAILGFTVAVIMVIIATYMIFISGSVALCRLLQKNKRYYYKARHFVSVSSMVYRMKRNGAGLASICILITMVLVMICSTFSLYIGFEDSLSEQYPRDISMRFFIPGIDKFNDETFSGIHSKLNGIVPEDERKNVVEFSAIDIGGLFTDEGILIDTDYINKFNIDLYDSVGYLHILTLDTYNSIMGTDETLMDGECILHCYRFGYEGETFTIENCDALKVKKVTDEMYISCFTSIQVVPTVTLVVNDSDDILDALLAFENELGDPMLELYYCCEFDLDADPEEEIEIFQKINSNIGDLVVHSENGGYAYSLSSKEEARDAVFGMYAGLLFIGVFLSVIFLFATIIIMYYKQISEGYEDRKRFEVMQKVGMTKRDIRRSVNSQVLTVFFLPLLFAGLHLVFAFPILWKMLQMFNFTNMYLMISVTAAGYAIFAAVYVIVYRITSNAYYAIVSGNEK